MSNQEELKKEIEEETKKGSIRWQDAADRLPSRTCPSHFFIYKGKGNYVQCKCGVGYQLTPPAYLKDGHIYLNDKLVI